MTLAQIDTLGGATGGLDMPVISGSRFDQPIAELIARLVVSWRVPWAKQTSATFFERVQCPSAFSLKKGIALHANKRWKMFRGRFAANSATAPIERTGEKVSNVVVEGKLVGHAWSLLDRFRGVMPGLFTQRPVSSWSVA